MIRLLNRVPLGTGISPYMIYSVSDAVGGLQNIPTRSLSAVYKIANNIDANETTSWNAGAGFSSIGATGTEFTGTLNGDSKIIDGLFISRGATGNIGLFGVITGATLQNIGLTDVNIAGASVVGGLVARTNTSTIDNCYSTGSVSGTSRIGGLVGLNATSSITNSYAATTVSGTSQLGGLVGFNSNSSIGNSYATGAVSGSSSRVGGLAGLNSTSSSIDNSYATGTASGTGLVGGLVGDNNASSIDNSYAIGVATSSGDTPGGLVGSNTTGSYDNNYWFNATNTVDIGSDGDVASITKASAASDFYSTSQAVYLGDTASSDPWNFSSIWDSFATAYPRLQYENVAGSARSLASSSTSTTTIFLSNPLIETTRDFDPFNTLHYWLNNSPKKNQIYGSGVNTSGLFMAVQAILKGDGIYLARKN